MSVLEAHALARTVQHFATTGTVNTVAFALVDPAVNGWNRIIQTLIEWGRNPAQFADGDTQPPTASAISAAVKVAHMFRDSQKPSPTLVAPDGEGGVSFEWRHAKGTDLLLVHSDSTVEMICFENHQITNRFPIVG